MTTYVIAGAINATVARLWSALGHECVKGSRIDRIVMIVGKTASAVAKHIFSRDGDTILLLGSAPRTTLLTRLRP